MSEDVQAEGQVEAPAVPEAKLIHRELLERLCNRIESVFGHLDRELNDIVAAARKHL